MDRSRLPRGRTVTFSRDGRRDAWLGPLLAFVIAILAFTVSSVPGTGEPTEVSAETRDRYRRPDSIPLPARKPLVPAKEKLGRMLFFDPIMSAPGTLSCASCHNPALSWTDGLTLAEGAGRMKWHTPPIIDIAWVPTLGWDGKFPALETVVFGPMLNPQIMNIAEAEILRRLSRIPGMSRRSRRRIRGCRGRGWSREPRSNRRSRRSNGRWWHRVPRSTGGSRAARARSATPFGFDPAFGPERRRETRPAGIPGNSHGLTGAIRGPGFAPLISGSGYFAFATVTVNRIVG